ncbi:MAG: hypothetical protein R3E95_10250 [Thiolinea sp.]
MASLSGLLVLLLLAGVIIGLAGKPEPPPVRNPVQSVSRTDNDDTLLIPKSKTADDLPLIRHIDRWIPQLGQPYERDRWSLLLPALLLWLGGGSGWLGLWYLIQQKTRGRFLSGGAGYLTWARTGAFSALATQGFYAVEGR